MSNTKPTVDSINILKGIAIFLVVIGHFHPNGVEYKSYSEFLNVIYLFHMPLFMMISGFLYAYTSKIETFGDYKRLVWKKYQRLVAPYCIISLIILAEKFVGQNFAELQYPVTKDSIINILVNPLNSYAVFLWYIYTLFLIFLIYPIFEKVIKSKLVLFVILFCISLIPAPQIFCLRTLVKYLLYFYLGCIAYRYSQVLIKINMWTVACVATTVIYLIYLYGENSVSPAILINVVRIFIAVLMSWFLFVLSYKMDKIDRTNLVKNVCLYSGIYSAPIYLLHTSTMGPIRIMIDSFTRINYVTFLISALLIVLCGMIGPILITRYIINRSRVVSKLILGVEPIK